MNENCPLDAGSFVLAHQILAHVLQPAAKVKWMGECVAGISNTGIFQSAA